MFMFIFKIFKYISKNIKIFYQFLLPKRILTILIGILADAKIPIIKNYIIYQFIKQYNINMTEVMNKNLEHYLCFNDFFIRRLNPNFRQLDKSYIVSPIDGYINKFGYIENGKLFKVKGRYYTIENLLSCSNTISDMFLNSFFITFYLSPKDYHRVHMPINGYLKQMIYIPGTILSIHPNITSIMPNFLVKNKRLVMFFETEIGLISIIFIGSIFVGKIGTKWNGDIKYRYKKIINIKEKNHLNIKKKVFKGEEIGYFKLGSTVILLFSKHEHLDWSPIVKYGNSIKYGQSLINDK